MLLHLNFRLDVFVRGIFFGRHDLTVPWSHAQVGGIHLRVGESAVAVKGKVAAVGNAAELDGVAPEIGQIGADEGHQAQQNR